MTKLREKAFCAKCYANDYYENEKGKDDGELICDGGNHSGSELYVVNLSDAEQEIQSLQNEVDELKEFIDEVEEMAYNNMDVLDHMVGTAIADRIEEWKSEKP